MHDRSTYFSPLNRLFITHTAYVAERRLRVRLRRLLAYYIAPKKRWSKTKKKTVAVVYERNGNMCFFGVRDGRLLESLPRPKSPGAAECSALGKWRLRRTRRPIGIGRFGGHYVCPLDEAVGALTSTPEEGNGVLLGVPSPSCLRGVNHARHCMGHDVEFDKNI